MKNYIESILFGICEKLQLTPQLYELATQRYETIIEILRKDDVFKQTELNVYPHGSFKLKTTVKPLAGEEFDLDFVAELPINSNITPKELYNHIVRILDDDASHKGKIEPKTRCVRVNYANDFHMDIMPGKLIDIKTQEIIVPDRDLKSWYHHSNPKGFAAWFENQARTRLLFEMSEFHHGQFDVEGVSEQEITAQLEPLRRAVQLVKRYRDIYCDKNNKEPVRSIVICALMGNITSFTGNTIQIISSFCAHVNDLIQKSNGQPFDVRNPVVNEVLTEKWHEGNNYQDFVDMMNALTTDIYALQQCSNNSEANHLTKKMFGEEITNASILRHTRILNEARQAGKLSVDKSGTLNTQNLGTPVKKNTFYGS
ncbi:MAG: nucleotidyltransferase [Clostridia bacterium]|nr:nucleotidyltransferase [Clostridia bacterium]